MPEQTEVSTRRSIYDVPAPDQKAEWRERVQKYGNGVTKVIQFISELADDVTPEKLNKLAFHDSEATVEAYATGELTDYDAGTPDAFGIADSSCLWKSGAAAIAAVHRPKHLRGVNYAAREQIYHDFIIREFDAGPDDDLLLKLTLVRTITKAQIEAHKNGGDFDA